MLNLGHSCVATVLRRVSVGLILDVGEGEEVLLPTKFCPDTSAENIEVFVYLDGEGRAIATTQTPKAEVGQFAYLQAIDDSDYGTFLDWGLDKDLLVPFGEQHRPMVSGKSYLVYVHISKADGRIIASSKIDKFLDDDRPHNFHAGQPVQLIIANSTELGFKAIVNNSHWGVLYKNEVTQRLSFGDSKSGFIKYVRPDGKLDLTLEGGEEVRDRNTETVLDYLRANDNFVPLHDKSNPEEIKKALGMSKGAFKKAVGSLYKRRLIALEKTGIRLLE
ncbi:MAG: S1-like domain-containing RNA-binding protein [Halieaceae bacterium]